MSDTFAAFLARPRTRHDDALDIQQGACNLVAISATLITAARECQDEGRDWRGDPALQLIVHQMCHLVGIMTCDHKPNSYGGFNYREADIACSRKASFLTAHLHATLANDARESALREQRIVGLDIAA